MGIKDFFLQNCSSAQLKRMRTAALAYQAFVSFVS